LLPSDHPPEAREEALGEVRMNACHELAPV